MNLHAVTGGSDGDGGLPHGQALTALAEAMLRGGEEATASARQVLRAAMGDAALVDAVAVVAAFNAIDRVADATGIPLDKATEQATADLRAGLGIDAFRAAAPDDPSHPADPPTPKQG